MSKSVKTPKATQHKILVNTLKAQLPYGWLKELQQRTGRRQTFVMSLINNYQDHKAEWAEVERLKNEYQSRLIEAEKQPA